MATIAPRLIKQRTAIPTVLITSNPAWPNMRIVSVGRNRALKWRPGRTPMTSQKSFVPELTRGRTAMRRGSHPANHPSGQGGSAHT